MVLCGYISGYIFVMLIKQKNNSQISGLMKDYKIYYKCGIVRKSLRL